MAFTELKQRQAAAWGSGPFERIEEQIVEMHDSLVAALDPQPGERFLDVGCGTGAIAMRAARAGAVVTALDLAAPLVETAKRRAEEEGLEIGYSVGDAEALPHEDASFDVVGSSVGAIFAPDHGAVARELARVTRPGGRIGLTAWRPDGRIGDMFRLFGSYQPPPPPDAGSPLEWGVEGHARELLGDAFDLRIETRAVPDEEESPEELWELFSVAFGPLRTLLGSLEPDRQEELRAAWIDLAERSSNPRSFLLILGTRR